MLILGSDLEKKSLPNDGNVMQTVQLIFLSNLHRILTQTPSSSFLFNKDEEQRVYVTRVQSGPASSGSCSPIISDRGAPLNMTLTIGSHPDGCW